MIKYCVTIESDVDYDYRLGTLGDEIVNDAVLEISEEVFGGEYSDAENLDGDSERWYFYGCTNIGDEAERTFDERIDDRLKAYRSSISFTVEVGIDDDDKDDDDTSTKEIKADLEVLNSLTWEDLGLKLRKAALEELISERDDR